MKKWRSKLACMALRLPTNGRPTIKISRCLVKCRILLWMSPWKVRYSIWNWARLPTKGKKMCLKNIKWNKKKDYVRRKKQPKDLYWLSIAFSRRTSKAAKWSFLSGMKNYKKLKPFPWLLKICKSSGRILTSTIPSSVITLKCSPSCSSIQKYKSQAFSILHSSCKSWLGTILCKIPLKALLQSHRSRREQETTIAVSWNGQKKSMLLKKKY